MSTSDRPRVSIIDGRTFLTSRRDGTIGGSDGLFAKDTRHLSAFDVTIAGRELAYVGADTPDAGRRTLWYSTDAPTVTDVPSDADGPPAALVLRREQRVVEGAGLEETMTLWNYGPRRFSGPLVVEFDVDFVDVFEVRGVSPGIERTIERDVGDSRVTYRYSYVDEDGETVRRATAVAFAESPDRIEPGRATYRIELASQSTASFEVTVRVDDPGGDRAGLSRAEPAGDSRPEPVEATVAGTDRSGIVRTIERAATDLEALTTDTEHGPVPVAGTPWYAGVFGRDSLIAAHQTLPFSPELAVGTLRFLAAHQGRRTDRGSDGEPGKILHELRHGELARTGRVPHNPYYGSVDATLLWLVLLSETTRWLGDNSLVEELWEPFERALGWVRSATDAVGEDPFLYYRTAGGTDLPHKAWRDSPWSVQFSDGTPASPPLASVDVQGYLYDALRRSASLLEAVGGEVDRATGLRNRADALADRFERAFWLPERSYYATAVTADGRPVDSVTSNVGHCLWSGIVDDARAADVADRLLAPDLFTGWGIRTMSAEDAGYNPVSYHTGSVWPHDTSLACLGLARYGRYEAAERVAAGLLEASSRFPRNSLPEVFCGFEASGPPKRYPATCVPQAWAAGAPFALLRSVFALRPVDGARPTPDRSPSIVDDRALEVAFDRWGAEGF